MKAKRIFSGAMCALLILSVLLCAACDSDTPNEESTEQTTAQSTELSTETEINYDGLNASDHVSFVSYKGMKIVLENEDDSKAEALLDAVYSSAVISSYPEDKVLYYFRQTKEAYMHAVNYNEEDYKLLLKNRATDEAKMMEEARALVKEDLIYRYILDAEGLVLTDAEKTANFDKYVEKFALDFKKPAKYIVAEMSDYVYDAMLYDKTMEFLIASNEFVVSGQSSETTDTQAQ